MSWCGSICVSSVLGIMCPFNLETPGPLNLGKFSQNFQLTLFSLLSSLLSFWSSYYLDFLNWFLLFHTFLSFLFFSLLCGRVPQLYLTSFIEFFFSSILFLIFFTLECSFFILYSSCFGTAINSPLSGHVFGGF